MASVNWKKRGKRYLVYWRADDGSQGGKTVDTEDQARLLTAQMLLELTSGTWTGPGGGNGVQAGTRTVLSRDNFRRVYHAALAKLADPAAIDLRPTARRVLAVLRADGVATAEELTNRLGGQGRRLKLGTVQAAARELEAAGLAIVDGGEAARWKAQPPGAGPGQRCRRAGTIR